MSHDPIDRRGFIQIMGGAAAMLATTAACATPRPKRPQAPKVASGLPGMLLVYTQARRRPQLHLFDTATGQRLTTFDSLVASHAIVAVESQNRFVVHGLGPNGQGQAWVIDVNPAQGTWSKPKVIDLGRGMALHWQPSADQRLIQYNTIEDGALHVLNTHTLEVERERGGGNHSNMAFFNDERWLLATDHLGAGTSLRVIDRVSGKILSQTPVGTSGHGVTVNDKTGTAFVWADDGVHMVDLSTKNLGQHLGIIAPKQQGQRSWFCWTPQGGRYSHDYSWNPGDTYNPWLNVLDMEARRIERLPTPGHTPGILQVSPDGTTALAGCLKTNHLLVFDLTNNTLKGTIPIGQRSRSFFDRDTTFSKDRTHGFATNPADKTISVLNLQTLTELARIPIPDFPIWAGAISAGR